MRGVLGIAGVIAVLVALVLGMRFSVDHTHFTPLSRKNTVAVKQVSTINSAAARVEGSAKLVAVQSDGTLRGLQVNSVAKGGIADRHFGLLPGDVIVRIGPFDMGDSTLTDFNTACDWLNEAYLRSNLNIGVERNGEELSLPLGDQADLPPIVASGGADGSTNPMDKSPQITNPGGDE